jgi:hypothetical protein
MLFYGNYSIMEHYCSILEFSSSQPKENSEVIRGCFQSLDGACYTASFLFSAKAELIYI